MASDINSVTLVGRLTRDSELKYSANGNAQVRFSLANGRSKRNSDGSWGTDTSYFDCIYFGSNAESISSYLQKGRQVAINGELRQSRWEGQDGQTRSRVDIIVNSLMLLAPPKGASETALADQIIQQNRQNSSYSQNQGGNNSSNGSYNNGGSYNNNSGNYARQPVHERPNVSSGPEDFQDDDIPF